MGRSEVCSCDRVLDLEHGDGRGAGGDRVEEHQRDGDRGVVADEEVPVDVGPEPDLAAGSDRGHGVARARLRCPPRGGAVAVQHEVDVDGAACVVHAPDRVATPDHAVVDRDGEAEVLPRHVAEVGERVAPEGQPAHRGGHVDHADDLQGQLGHGLTAGRCGARRRRTLDLWVRYRGSD